MGKRNELNQSIAVAANTYQLIFGYETLKNYQLSGKQTIPVFLISLAGLLKGAAYDAKLDIFSVSQQVELGIALEKYLESNSELKKSDLLVRQGTPAKIKTRDLVASKVGLGSGTTYERAKKIVISGQASIIKAMNEKTLSIRKAFSLLSQSDFDELSSLGFSQPNSDSVLTT